MSSVPAAESTSSRDERPSPLVIHNPLTEDIGEVEVSFSSQPAWALDILKKSIELILGYQFTIILSCELMTARKDINAKSRNKRFRNHIVLTQIQMRPGQD